MSYRVFLSNKAGKQYKKLDPHIRDTIKSKLDFCREVIKDFDENPEWQLTPKAEELCKKIFAHIENCNS